ncbi:MAG: AMP-binding protein, partial [Actinomycetota bacterium]
MTARDVAAERAEIEAAAEGRTFCTDLAATAARVPDQDAFRIRTGDAAYDSLTWSQFRDRVRDAALGFLSLGLEPGDFVLLQARCTPEHSIADMGVVHARGTPVSLYNTLAPEQISYIANH